MRLGLAKSRMLVRDEVEDKKARWKLNGKPGKREGIVVGWRIA